MKRPDRRIVVAIALGLVLLAAAAWYLRWRLPLAATSVPCPCSGVLADYPWPHAAPTYHSLASRFPPPPGARCLDLAPGSWGAWLRGLPMTPPGSPVRLYTGLGFPAFLTPWVAGVVDIDVRQRQECADTIFRLRLEYLRQAGREHDMIVPTGENDPPLSWTQWKQGFRPHQEGRRLRLVRAAAPDDSRACFDRYLASVFLWCGTYQLEQMGRPVAPAQIQVGDYFVRAGAPGHAILVADLARAANGGLYALFVQGHSPGQSAQVPRSRPGQVWYPLDPAQPVDLPDAKPFPWDRLRRFCPSAQ
jgi:hypothetical protein